MKENLQNGTSGCEKLILVCKMNSKKQNPVETLQGVAMLWVAKNFLGLVNRRLSLW